MEHFPFKMKTENESEIEKSLRWRIEELEKVSEKLTRNVADLWVAMFLAGCGLVLVGFTIIFK